MHVRRRKLLSAAVLGAMLSGVMVLGLAGPASAHEDFDVGKLHVAVGFGDEPAYVGYPNSVQMFLNTADDKPITEVPKPFKVTVANGGQTKDLVFEPDFEVGEFGMPGDYRAWFIPTQVGTYTFHVTGSANGQKVDVTAKSGPKTFSPVEGTSDVDFPLQQPSTIDLSTKLDQETSRSQAAIASANDAADSAKSSATTALIVGIVGVVLGLAGIGYGIAARRSGTTG
jgi:hypothetical protein